MTEKQILHKLNEARDKKTQTDLVSALNAKKGWEVTFAKAGNRDIEFFIPDKTREKTGHPSNKKMNSIINGVEKWIAQKRFDDVVDTVEIRVEDGGFTATIVLLDDLPPK